MRVDESGHDRAPPDIDHFGVGRNGKRALVGTDLHDMAAGDQDGGRPRRCTRPIKKPRIANEDEDFVIAMVRAIVWHTLLIVGI